MENLDSPKTDQKQSTQASIDNMKEGSTLSEKDKTLSQRLDEIKEKFDSHHTQHTAKKIEALENDTKDLAKTVHSIEGGLSYITIAFAIVSIFFAFGSIFGFYRIYQYETFKASTEGINQLLVKQIENQTRVVINRLNISKSSDQEREDVENLKQLTEFLDELKPNDKKFDGTKALVNILYEIVVEENMEEALKVSKETMNRFPDNKFVLSRAETLYALIPIAEDRNKPSDDEKESRLRDAIKIDNTNAGAFNSLGITVTAKTLKNTLLTEKNFNDGYKLMKEATLNFEIASLLNPSATGKLKYINNKTFCNLLLLKYLLKEEGVNSPNITRLLQDNNYTTMEEFFEDSSIGLRLYEEYTDFPNPPETLAQLLWLQAEYERKSQRYAEKDITDLENQGARKFEAAIRRQIYNRVKTRTDAVDQFNSDYLHEYIISQRPEIAEQIRKRITGD
jgi:hypothetical protein